MIKMKEMLKVREWKYTVKNIEFTNKGDLGDYFLCFKLGSRTRSSRNTMSRKIEEEDEGQSTSEGRIRQTARETSQKVRMGD